MILDLGELGVSAFEFEFELRGGGGGLGRGGGVLKKSNVHIQMDANIE